MTTVRRRGLRGRGLRGHLTSLVLAVGFVVSDCSGVVFRAPPAVRGPSLRAQPDRRSASVDRASWLARSMLHPSPCEAHTARSP